MTPRERQLELSKVLAGTERAVRNREIAALLVVALRHDGQITHGTVVTGGEFVPLVQATGEVLRRVKEQFDLKEKKG